MTGERAIEVLGIMKSQMKEFGMTARFEGLREMQETAVDVAVKSLSEIQQYRAIGTVEECREARERQRGKKPNKRTDKYTDLIQHYSCPVCGKYFGQAGVHNVILFEKPKYCTCGQAISWESDAP